MDNQIEELAKDLQEAWTAWSLSKDLKTPYAFVADILAKKWHPKIPEGVVDYIELGIFKKQVNRRQKC